MKNKREQIHTKVTLEISVEYSTETFYIYSQADIIKKK